MSGPVVLVDLDGVVWSGEEPIAGSAGAVAALRAGGARVAFFTNNSWSRLDAHLRRLGVMGIDVLPGDVLTSSQAAAGLLSPADTALVLGGPGLAEALEARRVKVILCAEVAGELDRTGARAGVAAGVAAEVAAAAGVAGVAGVAGAAGEGGEGAGGGLQEQLTRVAAIAPPEVTAVVAGIDPDLDYARLAVAAAAIRSGARFLATNTDATYPTGRGLVPGAGAVVAALRVAAGVDPVVAGKPYEPAAALARERLGSVAWVVGDRPDTDGALAARLGAPFALVLSGVTPPGHGALEPVPDAEADDLAALVPALLAGLDGRERPGRAGR